MLDNEEILEKKQNYLRKEIIDKGFSPDDFANYVQKIKGENGADLNSWSIEELYYIVPQFQEAYNLEKQKNNKNFSNFNNVEEQETEHLGTEDEDLWGNKIPKTKKISCIVKCKKLEISELAKNKEKLIININNAEIKKEGLFSYSYYEFIINNKILNIEIKRKANDFIWLKNKLTNFYPNIFIPPLPKFKIKKDEKYIHKKIYYLQCFLNYIINNDILLSSKLFNDFISLPESEFQNTKQIFDKLEPPKGLDDIITLDGTFDIAIIPDIDKKAYTINNEILKKNELFNKLNLCLKETINQMIILKQKYLQLSNIFEELYQFWSKSEIITNDKMNKNFFKLKDIFKTCTQKYEQKINYFDFEIKKFFKYMRNELNEFDYLYKNYDAARTTFIDVTDRKNIVMDENFKGLKRYFGYTLNIVFNEYNNLNLTHFLRTKEHFNDISQIIII